MFPAVDLVSIWAWLTAPQPSLPWWGAAISLLAGSAFAFNGNVWRHTRILAVYFHEAGHAVAALLTGRRLLGIRLYPDGSGSTLHEGPAGGIGRLLTAFAGYPAPAMVGWEVLMLSSDGLSRASVGLLAAICLLLLIFQRSWRGWALTAAVLASSVILASFEGLLLPVVMSVVAGYLFAAAPRTIWELHHARRAAAPGEQHSDSDALARMTGIPAVVWEVVFLAFSGWLIWQAFPSFA